MPLSMKISYGFPQDPLDKEIVKGISGGFRLCSKSCANSRNQTMFTEEDYNSGGMNQRTYGHCVVIEKATREEGLK